ncbi:hypothetical protein MKW92_041989 [Papaver armeniacum]|nr:hypothetical protein MKW92_041989 [Papaver armeniacum]
MVDLLINILTITLTIGVPHAVLSFVNNGNPFPDIYNQTIPSIITINETCTRTLYQSLCFTSFSSFPSSIRITSLERFLEFSINEIVKSNALNDCIEMLDQTLYELEQVSNGLKNYSVLIGFRHQLYSEFKTLLGAAMTNENTCIQGIEDVEEANPETYMGFKDVVQRLLNPVSKMIRNCLEMVKYMELTSGEMIIAKQRPVSHGFPLIQIIVPQIMSNTIVAVVGHGNYCTISAKKRMAPSFGLQSYVIKIKAGVYNESTGCKNFLDGSSTFKLATLNRFLARDLTVIHTSVTSDSAFYKCNFASFQDTLYVHSLCQLYRECTIQGTVDFIFGNAAAIFQNCLILPNQSTGILLQNCTIKAAPDLMRASRIERVTWGGYKRNCSEDLVEQFTVRKFLHGADNWLHSTSFPLSLGS